MTGRYRFLRTPRWIAGVLLVAAVAVVFVNLGLWQLRRLDERRDHNDLVERRMETRPAPLGEVVGGRDGAGDAPDAERAVWRRVRAEGTYDLSRQVLVRNRSLAGRPGYNVLTPLVLDDGAAVYVNRGWIPAQSDLEDPSTGEEPPREAVRVEGVLVPGDSRGPLGPTDPEAGVLGKVVRVDLDRLQQQSPWPLVPVLLKLDEQTPPTPGNLPVALPDPELSERNHLSYAIQWFLFAAIAVVGFPLLVRRHAKDNGSETTPLPEPPARAGAQLGEATATPRPR